MWGACGVSENLRGCVDPVIKVILLCISGKLKCVQSTCRKIILRSWLIHLLDTVVYLLISTIRIHCTYM